MPLRRPAPTCARSPADCARSRCRLRCRICASRRWPPPERPPTCCEIDPLRPRSPRTWRSATPSSTSSSCASSRPDARPTPPAWPTKPSPSADAPPQHRAPTCALSPADCARSRCRLRCRICASRRWPPPERPPTCCEINPPAPALAEHLAFRYTVQHEFVLRVIEAGRPTDAVRLADEAIALGRRAAAAPGADVRGVASQLHTLSLQTALPNLRAQSVAAAVAAADLLRPLEPPMPALAPHLMLRGTVLRDLTLRLIEAGRTPEAAGPADEAIFVLKRAVVAGGNAPSIRQVLSSFALQLAGGGLQAQSEAAQQAAQEIPEG